MNNKRKKTLQKIKAARGQLDGITRMMEERRYCIDIPSQISAPTVLLKKANQHTLSGRLHSYVLIAIEERDTEEKVSEIKAATAVLLKQKGGKSYERNI